MSVHYLRADNEAAAVAALTLLRNDDGWIKDGPGWTLSIIGPVTVSDAVPGDDGEIVTPPDIDWRWHANLLLEDDCPQRAEILAAIAAVEIAAPTHPVLAFS